MAMEIFPIQRLSLTKKVLGQEELIAKISELKEYYMPIDLNSEYHAKKKIAIKKLSYIYKHATRQSLQDSDIHEMIYCSLTTVYYFGMHLRLFTTSFKNWLRKRNFIKAELLFQKTMDKMLPETSDQTVRLTLKFFTATELWPYENFVGQILEVMLYFSKGKTTLYNVLLTDIHFALFKDVKMARHRMRVLYEVLKSENWLINKQNLLPFITRLLDFFAYSISKNNEKATAYAHLRKGFEVCLRRIFERVGNEYRLTVITSMLNWFSTVVMTDDDVLEFSTLLDYAATLYKVDLYKISFSQCLFEDILNQLVVSANHLYSMLGCRLMQRFLDRQQNCAYLSAPTIFYEFSQVHLRVGKYESSDKAFVKQHRELLHNSILQAVMKHRERMSNQKALYAIIFCVILEVPCGLTAAASTCLVMAIQEFALNGENLSPSSRYWMHAIVISVMSLICWVHKAPVLFRYVNQIISRRAKEAPQLNPPLMQVYSIAHHHITWNKPTLFFEDWEGEGVHDDTMKHITSIS